MLDQVSVALISLGIGGLVAGGFFNLLVRGPASEPGDRAETWRILAPHMWRYGLVAIALGGIGLILGAILG